MLQFTPTVHGSQLPFTHTSLLLQMSPLAQPPQCSGSVSWSRQALPQVSGVFEQKNTQLPSSHLEAGLPHDTFPLRQDSCRTDRMTALGAQD